MQIGTLHLDNNICLAPMAGITNLPYRRVMKRHGAGLVFTEMVSANGLIRNGRGSFELLASHPDEGPLGIQLFGDDPTVLAEATRMIAGNGALIDLNMGCPVKKVVRSGAGSALMRTPARAAEIIRAVRGATSLPLTVKMRSGWDACAINFPEIGRIAEAEGADAITLHPRTRTQGYGGDADWTQIKQLKEAVRIPVIGSGDVITPGDALAMQEQTGCDGVMIGRGSYGNPWLFSGILAMQRGEIPRHPTGDDRFRTAMTHLELFIETFDPAKAVLEMRKHLCWYSRGLSGASEFRGRVNQLSTLSDLKSALQEFFLPVEAKVA